jgi:sphingolipid delta-4 desaturase
MGAQGKITAFIEAGESDPHLVRMRGLLAAHPELKSLVGPAPETAWWIAATVTAQTFAAAALAAQPWWAIVAAAYLVGAIFSLALWTLLHECTHDLVLRRSLGNRWLGIFTGLPLVVPAAASFRKWHLMHHRHHGDPILDGDIPSAWEARWVGGSAWRKAVWLFGFAGVQMLRPARMKGVKLVDRWFVANVAAQFGFCAALIALSGWGALLYLLLSNIFSLGLHPLGARWIQEHYLLRPGQETYSYYGPMNRLVFNAGYHNEHHDLMRVPWMRLPEVKAIAPEYYEPLYAHRSWTALLLRFLFDGELTPFCRAIRVRRAGSEGR